MSMTPRIKISITDWRCKNLRIGVGEESFQLGDPPRRCSLIQMPNGLGKTSTMTLIRAVLGGEKFSPEKVQSFRANDDVKTGEFELGLLLEGHEKSKERYRLTAKFDFNKGECHYSTSRSKERGGGLEPGRNLPEDIKHIMYPELIKLFVFDGELARDILDNKKNAADNAIRTLYQLNDINNLQNTVRETVELIRENLDRTTGKKKNVVTIHERKLKDAKSCKDGLEKKLNNYELEHTDLKTELEMIITEKNLHIARHDDLRNRLEELNKIAVGLTSDVQTETQQTIQSFRNPIALSSVITSRLKNLGSILTRARLPKSVSSDFFDEIAAEDKCICGRPIGEEERKVIIQQKKQYLGQDQISVIAAMKGTLNASTITESSFLDFCNKLQSKLEDRQANKKAKVRLELEVEERGDEEMHSLKDQEKDIEIKLGTIEKEIKRLNQEIPDAIKEVEDCMKTLDEARESYRLSRQCEKLLDQLNRIEKKALVDLREDTREKTNEQLKTLVLMEDLHVEQIVGALKLSSNKASRKDGVSEGQSLSVAYAFLTALLSKAPFELPFIVDSPAVSLDLDVRKEVSSFIPKLFEQLILFVISSEQAAFAEHFFDRNDTTFLTTRQTAKGNIEIRYGLNEFRRETFKEVNI